MKKTMRVFSVLLVALFLLSSCGMSEKQTKTFFAMNTVMDVTVYGEKKLLTETEETVKRLEKLFSVTDSESEISMLNQNGGGTVSRETSTLISNALQLCEQTGGALDITVYPVLLAWGFTTGDYRVPQDEEIKLLLNLVDYGSVAVEGTEVRMADGVKIDLGSVAKGYTADCLAQQLTEKGVESALLNLGGNIQAIGTKPNGEKWRIAVRNPSGPGNLAVLQVSDCAVVTSGGYERYFEQEGKIYHHIIDPSDGYPAESGLLSVTVVARSGLLADALSTALYVMGPERAVEYWRNHQNFEMLLVDSDGIIWVTEPLESVFKATSPESVVKVVSP